MNPRRYCVTVGNSSLRVEQNGFHLARHTERAGEVCFLRDYPLPDLTGVAQRILAEGLEGLRGVPDNTLAFVLRYHEGHREVIGARDTIGNTPLYAARDGGELVFSSDLLSLHTALPGLARTLNHRAVGEYLLFRYTSGPNTLHTGISQPLAAHAMVSGGSALAHLPFVDIRQYFVDGDFARASAAVRHHLDDSLRREEAFPRLGLMFSGGLDSCHLAYSCHHPDLRLYTLAFPAVGEDDLLAAQVEASALNRPLVAIRTERGAFADRLPGAIQRFGWPLDHPNFVARDILFERAAADGVDRVLSGDGSDTIFGGAWYVSLYKALLVKRWLPRVLRYGRGIHPRFRQIERLQDTPIEDLVLFDKTYYAQSTAIALAKGRSDSSDHLRALQRTVANWDPLDQAFYLAHLTTLSVYPSAQRGMAWAWGVDVGYPFLSEAIVRLALSVRGRSKVRGLRPKRLFRQAATAVLPRRVIDRRKYGLPVPLADFILGERGMLRYQDLLRAGDSAISDAVDRSAVLNILDRLSARAHVPDDLELYWVLLNLEIWARQFLRGEALS